MQKSAEKAAYVALLCHFHKSGSLRELFGPIVMDTIDQQTIADEADAKMDIYNYAARFDCVPRFNIQSLNKSLRGRLRKVIEVTVALPEQDIKVSAKEKSLKHAEIAAAISFKKEAERYQGEHGDGAIVIKDSTTINSSNARNFMEYYKIVRPGARVEVKVLPNQQYRSFGAVLQQAQVFINDEPVGEPVEMILKKKAEDLAYLTAAIALKKGDPDLYPAFLQAARSGNGEILRPVSSISMFVDQDCVLAMNQTLLSARKAGLPDEEDEALSDEDVSSTGRPRYRRQLTPSQVKAKNWELQQTLSKYLQNPKLEDLRTKRKNLPMNQYRDKVLEMINNNTYSIVIGATGSGKTTQVPQILLEKAISQGEGAACNIICTQPRRIAATSVSRRVAEERAETLQESVGYQVRFDTKLPLPGGSITYCTTGILLQQLQHSPDDILDDNSHIIIDEVHERDIQIDFLLIILKKAILERAAAGKSVPKVILMSATIDTDLFASYFKSSIKGEPISACPTLSVPGRTFPVKEVYLEDTMKILEKGYAASSLGIMEGDPATREYLDVERRFRPVNAANVAASFSQENQYEEAVIDWKRQQVISSDGETVFSNEREASLVPIGLVASTIAHICKTSKEGAVLVFLPGLDDIVKVDELLRKQPLGVNFGNAAEFKISMLHSSIAAGQTEVFDAVPEGCRKIILATNIAETSITIPDVQFVVDTGKLREKQYDQMRRITKLQCTWISKSNSKQRAGRAGRVQNGNYYALFSRARYGSMRAIGLPEILRSDLQETCLAIKAQAFRSPIREFLAEAIEPPSPKAVNTSVMNLQGMDALTDDEKITSLGRLLASLPVHPSLGKMIVLGVIFRCLDPMITLGAAASERQIFLTPLGQRQEAAEARLAFVEGSGSDHIALINAIREVRLRRDAQGRHAMFAFCHQNFLHAGAFQTIMSTGNQIEQILADAKLIPSNRHNANRDAQFGGPSLNRNSSNVPLVKAIALAGLRPNLAVSTGGRTLRTPGEKGTILHPSSVNAPRDRKDEDRTKFGTLFSYSTMAHSNDGKTIFLRDTTECTPLMAALFGGRLYHPYSSVLEMDKWLPFYVKSEDRRAAKTIVEFRKALERLLAGAFRDLKPGQQVEKGVDGGGGFLADERVRETFAEGLVQVLARDVRVKESVAQRGWRPPKDPLGPRGESGASVEELRKFGRDCELWGLVRGM